MNLKKAFIVGAISLATAVTSLPAMAKDLKVVASFSILGDMVEQVVGDLGMVETIVGPDADAHVYQPSVADARAVAQADIIFMNGLGFETWSETIVAESGTKAAVFAATEGVTPLVINNEPDPHAWNSLKNGIQYVENIAKGLAKVAPKNAAKFDANAKAYIAKLEALDAKAKAAIAKLPKENRTVVTAHDAFGYMEQAYGLTFLAPVGIDTEAEPSAKDLAQLIAQIKKDGVAALFVENITSPALVKQISAETGIEVGGRLFSDALSERGGPATSYIAMFEHNMTSLVSALGAKK